MAANLASKRTRTTFYPSQGPEVRRPRPTGITHVLDRLHALDPSELAYLAPYIDVVKIAWGMPLLLTRDRVRERIRKYHDYGIEVSTGGTLIEYAVTQDRVGQMIDESRELGFDLIEVSSGVLDLSSQQIERLVDAVRRRSLDYFIEVGKKDPQRQLSLKETNSQIGFARALKPRRVILEGAEEGRGVGIFDVNGAIKWDWVRSILSEHPLEELLFEAPLEPQHTNLLHELGAEVNLGNISLPTVSSVASERLGLRGETFGKIRHVRAVKGPPAAKFLYFLLETHHGLDQTQLAHMSRLPRRTVQSALDSLRRQGLIQEAISLNDSRRREYRLV